MANQRKPSNHYRADDPIRADDDPYRTIDPTTRPESDADAPYRRDRLKMESQADPELPASSGKIALFAIGAAVVLGALFYGLNNSSVHQNGASSTAQKPAPATAQNTTPASSPSGMRDAAPRGNTGPGMTTGAAPSPAAPANNAPASK
ncbi:MAG TPA: hypothetical protein VKS24_08450 [Bradyrhizobium sp.]|nr:hypothetical protein [Bradyrhizobium sp.]